MTHIDTHIDRRHSPSHSLTPRGVDPLDAFIDTVTAQTVDGLKTFSGVAPGGTQVRLPLLGTGPSQGSQAVRKRYVDAIL